MTPNLGQGAAQALEDAVVLGKALGAAPTSEQSLRRYESLRAKRANAILRQSRQAGHVAQLRSPSSCAIRDAVFRALPDSVARKQQERLARFELLSK